MEESVSAQRPDDLIPAREAAQQSGKGLSTVRLWVRKGKVTGYRKDPKLSNSSLMISQAELRTFLAINGKPTHPNTEGRKPDVSASVQKLHKDNERLTKELANLQLEVTHQKQLTDMQLELLNEQKEAYALRKKEYEAQIAEYRSMVESMSKQLDAMKAQREATEKRESQLISYITLPWWKRMSTSLLLTG